MSKISTYDEFKRALESLPLSQQRLVGARFIANVLDLTTDDRIKNCQTVASKADVTADELLHAYHLVHAAYVETNPRSGYHEVNYHQQAAHFVAEACLVCLSPTYHEDKTPHVADKVAAYCSMARTCASIDREKEYPSFANTELMVKEEIDAQYEILSNFLASN